MSGRHIRRLAGMMVLWLVAGCGSSPTAPTAAATTSVTVSGNPTLNGIGQTSQLSATAKFTDGSTQDVTSKATWQSANSVDVSVSSTGVATGTGYGLTSVNASYQGVSGALQIATVLVDLTGNWKGTALSSDGSSTAFTMALSQAATTVSGSGAFTLPSAAGTGTFTGTVDPSGTDVNYAVSVSAVIGSLTCAINYSGTGQVSGATFTGTYTGTNSCSAIPLSGQFTMTKQ